MHITMQHVRTPKHDYEHVFVGAPIQKYWKLFTEDGFTHIRS